MDRRTKIFLGVSAVLLAGMLAVPQREPETASTPTAAPVAAGAVEAADPTEPVRAATPEQLERQRARAARLVWARDPFFPLTAEPAPAPDPEPELVPEPSEPVAWEPVELTGISERDGVRWALLDGQLVQEGEALSSGHQVARIERRSVLVLRDGLARVLTLGEEP